MTLRMLVLAVSAFAAPQVADCWGQSHAAVGDPQIDVIQAAVHIETRDVSLLNELREEGAACDCNYGRSPFVRCDEAASHGCRGCRSNLFAAIAQQTGMAFNRLVCRSDVHHVGVALSGCDAPAPVNCGPSKSGGCKTSCRRCKGLTITLFPCHRGCCSQNGRAGDQSLENRPLGDADDRFLEPPTPMEDDEGAPPRPPPGARVQPRWLTPYTDQQRPGNQPPAMLIPTPSRSNWMNQREGAKPRIVHIGDESPRHLATTLSGPINQPRPLATTDGIEFQAERQVGVGSTDETRRRIRANDVSSTAYLAIPLNPLR